jgi:hypothetical protein
MSGIENVKKKDLVKRFFDNYNSKDINFNANEVDATIGFFINREFDNSSAINISSILLQQAKKDKVDIYQLLDTLKGVNEIQLSTIVAKIMNSNRSNLSLLGLKRNLEKNTIESRNIVY